MPGSLRVRKRRRDEGLKSKSLNDLTCIHYLTGRGVTWIVQLQFRTRKLGKTLWRKGSFLVMGRVTIGWFLRANRVGREKRCCGEKNGLGMEKWSVWWSWWGMGSSREAVRHFSQNTTGKTECFLESEHKRGS